MVVYLFLIKAVIHTGQVIETTLVGINVHCVLVVTVYVDERCIQINDTNQFCVIIWDRTLSISYTHKMTTEQQYY